MDTKTLLADPAVLRIEKIVAEKSSLIIFVSSVQKHVRCQVCQHISVKRHSRYIRRLADLPWQGVAVKLCLSMRRFFCTNDLCVRKIFAERLPNIAADFARRTLRLNESLTALAFALGGEAGRRLEPVMNYFFNILCCEQHLPLFIGALPSFGGNHTQGNLSKHRNMPVKSHF